MRIIVNENVTRTVIDELRQKGHDVISVKEAMRGEADATILARAEREQRLVVTHDKDFGVPVATARNLWNRVVSIIRFQPGHGQPTYLDGPGKP